MTFTLLYVIVGVVFVTMAMAGSFLKRLPLSSSLVYLVAGVAIGPVGLNLVEVDIIRHAVLVERLTEVAVVVSLFTAGLKLRIHWTDRLWLLPLRLATISMVLTFGMVALVGGVFLGLTAGLAILLGGILAPTDPVLASDVQVADPTDQDRLRLGLTGEAGLNDGAAFPLVLLSLGILGHHEIGMFGWQWVAVDLIWAITAAIAFGAVLGSGLGLLVLFLREHHKSAVGLHEFLTLGLIALTYGGALLIHAYGFLAVFVAGLALRRIEQHHTGDDFDMDILRNAALDENDEHVATREDTAPVYLLREVTRFNEQLERIGEVAIVVLVGVLLSHYRFPAEAIWFIPVLFAVIRPLAVRGGLLGAHTTTTQMRLMAWFGIRGIGSLYYLSYAIVHGLSAAEVEQITALILATMAASILLHGVSVTPLMTWYERRAH